MSATTIIAQAFGENADLYTTVLGMSLPTSNDPSDVTPSQLRKAYYKRALLYHPDKQKSQNSNDECESTKLKFQAVSVAYSILSDPIKKKEYDATGELDDSNSDSEEGPSSGTNVWSKYFKSMFGPVTSSSISSFALSYKCSAAEREDVLKYYGRYRGDVGKILECVMCSSEVDLGRWLEDYIRPGVESGEVEDFLEVVERGVKEIGGNDDEEVEAVVEDDEETESEVDSDEGMKSKKKKTSKKVASKPKPKPKPKRKKKKKTGEDTGPSEDLVAAIRGRRSSGGGGGFGNFMTEMEERYGEKRKTKKSDYEDIPDDEFEKIRARLDGKRKKR